MSQVIQNSSNYVTHPGFLSKMRYHRVPLSNVASNSLPISLNSVNLGEFRLSGGQVFNLGKSFIGYNYTVLAAGAGLYNVVHEVGQDLCQWISFGDGSNVNLADIQYSDRYVKMIRSLRTSKDEFNALDRENCNYKSNALASSNVLPFSRDGTTAGLQNACSVDYDEVQYLRIAPNANQALTVNRLLPLSCFKDSFIGMDKNMVFANETFLRFNTQYASRLCFTTTTPANPHVGAADIASGKAPPQYNNVYLYLAVETNDKLIEQVKSKMLSGGIRLSIPFQHGYRHSSAASATTSSLQLTLTQQFGRKIKRIITALFNGNSEISQYTYDHSNVNGTKCNTVRSSLDSVPLQDYALNCFNPEESINPLGKWTYPTAVGTGSGDIGSDDYREMRSMLMGSAMPSYSEFQTNFFFSDNFGMNPMMKSDAASVEDADIDDGLTLVGVNKVYNVQFENRYAATAANNYGGNSGILAMYTFAYFVKDIVIDREGIKWL